MEVAARNLGRTRASRPAVVPPNGTAWATPAGGNPAPLLRWTLTRQRWALNRRDDIRLTGVEPCLPVLGLDRAPSA